MLNVILLNRGTSDESVIYMRMFNKSLEFDQFIDVLRNHRFKEYFNFYNGCLIHNKTYSIFPVWMFDIFIVIWRSDLDVSTNTILAMTHAYYNGAINDD